MRLYAVISKLKFLYTPLTMISILATLHIYVDLVLAFAKILIKLGKHVEALSIYTLHLIAAKQTYNILINLDKVLDVIGPIKSINFICVIFFP